MSDYLWDKTGEPEEDVERLEELLGQLRFQPRTFEVPAVLPVAPRRAQVARHTFDWSRLAVAASLLLVLLAGAWLIATRQRTNGTPQLAGAPSNGATPNATQQPATPQPGKEQLASAATSDNASAQERKQREVVERAGASNAGGHQRHEFVVAHQKRPAEPARHLNGRDESAPRGEVATMTPREREAMEKFLLAMKVTSEKLNYAERQVATLSHDEPQR